MKPLRLRENYENYVRDFQKSDTAIWKETKTQQIPGTKVYSLFELLYNYNNFQIVETAPKKTCIV